MEYWIWLSRIEGLDTKTMEKLLNFYKTPDRIWKQTKEELLTLGIETSKAEEIVKLRYRQNLKAYIDYMKSQKIEVITRQDEDYPDKLRNIYDPPQILYVQGNKQILKEKSIAIVGSRMGSPYGRKIAEKFAYELAKKNMVVLSGLASGIDSCAHKGALKAEGKTIAVLGNGLDRIYPTENQNLAKEILAKGGAILSEYVIGTKPLKMNFPKRNRIMSGMSDGVLVIEAKQKSGSLITVDFALEQGKEVYAVPGNITSITSEGTNELLKQGAKIVTKVEDIIEDFLPIL